MCSTTSEATLEQWDNDATVGGGVPYPVSMYPFFFQCMSTTSHLPGPIAAGSMRSTTLLATTEHAFDVLNDVPETTQQWNDDAAAGGGCSHRGYGDPRHTAP
jgi:hypothetical protein